MPPSQDVQQAFGAAADPRPLDGGQGQTWLAGTIVLKPASMAAEARWRLLRDAVSAELHSEEEQIERTLGANLATVVEAYRMLLEDPAFNARIDAEIAAGFALATAIRNSVRFFSDQFLAMDDPKLMMADTDRIAIDRQYIRCDAGEAIEAFRARRRETLDIFRALTPEQWNRGGIHPQHGRLTFENFLAIIAWHDDNHLDQIERALAGQV